jgi:hypothetical protein
MALEWQRGWSNKAQFARAPTGGEYVVIQTRTGWIARKDHGRPDVWLGGRFETEQGAKEACAIHLKNEVP